MGCGPNGLCRRPWPIPSHHREPSAMTQAQLECAVARSTGESLCTVRHRGFHVLSHQREDLEPEALQLAVDCPFCGASCALQASPDGLPEAAGCDHCDVE